MISLANPAAAIHSALCTLHSALRCALLLVGTALISSASAVSTDGMATFTVTLTDPPTNYNKRVDAFWVTDNSGKFIQNVRKDAATRQGYLYKWAAARGSYTNIDGYSGATISTWTPMTVTWDCRDTNNVVVPDGTYKFYVEFTDKNGQGPWTTNGIAFVKGATALTNTYPDQDYITAMKVVYLPAHELSVTAITPGIVPPNTNATLYVSVTNKTDSVESFSTLLSNVTSGAVIGTQTIGSLAGHTVTNVAFQWNTAGLLGNYSLRAQAGPVTGETNLTDNALNATVTVQVISHDIAATSLTPTLVAPTNNAIVYVGVTNNTASTESFSVVLSNLTTLSQIGSQTIPALGGNKSTNLAFTWNTTSLLGNQLLKVTAGPIGGESSTTDNTLSNMVMVRPLTHDVAIGAFNVPSLVTSNSTASLTVLATNLGEAPESFSVQLFDATAARSIGSTYQLTNLAASASTNLSFLWTTTNTTLGYHTLRVVATPVWGESALANNTNSLQVPVANGWTARTLIAKGSAWRYSDQGLDLTETPWRLPGYYDAVWNLGAAPLGYSQNGQLTNLATPLSWGPDAANKYPAYYFRQEFYADVLPSSLTLNVRRVDGVAVYLNGAELARFNLPGGPLVYTNLASSPVSGTNQYAYFSTNVVATNVVFGKNALVAEVHRANSAGSDLAFDLELTGNVPQIPVNHLVNVVGLTTPGDVLAGDRLPVTVTVTNRGNTTETVLVILKNGTQIVDAQTVTGLAPGQSAIAQFDWGTLGAQNGTNSLVACTVVGGVTNVAGAFTNTVAVSGAGMIPNPVNAAGAIGGRCAALATNANLLLVGAGATLEVWDAANPTALVKRGAVRLPGLIEAIATSGSYAFVACGQAGVQFVDLSSPAVPVHRTSFNTSGHAYGVAVNGNYLYVADGVAGLRVLNIAAPATPSLVGAYYTQGPARAVALSATRACVLDQHNGLQILDLATPWAPTLAGACTNFDAGQGLAVLGSTAYVVDANNHFFVVDLANPSLPTLTGSLLLPNMVGQAVALSGTTAYVAGGADGLLVINVAVPSSPVLQAMIPLPDQAVALAVAGSNLYVANGFAGFQSFDLTVPLDNSQLSTLNSQLSYPTALRANDVVITNEMAYIAAGEGGLQIFTLTNPLAPVQLSRFTGATNARAIALSGTTAYVGDGQYGLKIIDIANPLAPALLGTYASTNLGSIRNVGVSGSLIVVSDGRTVQLLDAASPAAPSLAGTYTPPGFAFSLAVDSARAYLACGNAGLIILNVAPGAFTLLGSYTSTYAVSGVAACGTNAYIAHPAVGWRILNVANPAVPTLVKSTTAQGPVTELAASGTNVMVLTTTNAAKVVDVTTPLTPVQTRSFGPLVRAVRLAASPTLVVTAEEEAGLAVFATTDDLDQDGLPDWWEQQILALSAATNGPLRTLRDVRPKDDFDGDGVSNYAEYIAGTSPIDAGSVFLFSVQKPAGNSNINLRWYSVAGKTYTIYKSTELKAGFTVFKDNIAATPPLNVATDSPTNGAAFYIIGVR